MNAPLVARLGAMTNLVHGFIYFAPEAAAAYEAVGLAPRQQYFASRAAPMGPVPAEVVVATFFNFDPAFVASGMEGAWAAADPVAIQEGRMRAAGEVLRRCCPDVEAAAVEEASEIAGAMADGIGYEGRTLAAANRSVPEPSDAIERLWQRITVLREWRGDAHVAALVAAPVSAVEALVLHAATDQVPRSALVTTRQWSEGAWRAGVEQLAARGLVNDDESFTDAGRAYREQIEAVTDAACLPMIDVVGEESAGRLLELLKPVRRGLLDGGAFAMMGR